MKKTMMIVAGMASAGVAAYVLINKQTRKKAEKVLNSMLDEADSMIRNQDI